MHLLPRFEFHEPKDLAEACTLLSQLGADAKIIAGGTDLLVSMKQDSLCPKHLVSISRIPELFEIEPRDGTVAIGSHVIVAKLLELDLIHDKLPLLTKGAGVLGSPLVRNRATIGGNIVTARPAADLPSPLMALGAVIRLTSREGDREMPLEDFFVGPGETVIKPAEILTTIVVDEPPPHTGGDYIKLGHRQACEICITAGASMVTLDKPDGIIQDARVLLGAVAPTIIHAASAEEVLRGERPSPALFEKAAEEAAGKDAQPISDMRGSEAYRRAMVKVVVKRTLFNALKEAQAN